MNIFDYSNVIDFSNLSEFQTITMFTTKKNNTKSPEENFNDVCVNYNIKQKNIASCIQVHSKKVIFIDKPGIYKNIDGLVTFLDSGILLKIQTADCVPVFMIDIKNNIIGLVHSGWKGTKDSIVLSALKIFYDYGSNNKNIAVCIGPCIKECCYEVKHDVSRFFDKKNIVNRRNKLFLNLVSKIKDDLYKYGVNSIYESNICTYHNEEYHSYRREKGGNLRMYSIIGKKC